MMAMIALMLMALTAEAACREFEPEWVRSPEGTPLALREVRLTMEAEELNAAERGEMLVKAVAALRPGEKLVLAAGTYVVTRRWEIGISGTAAAPVWIAAESGAEVVITRPDAEQNVINLGSSAAVHHFVLQGVTITGGSHGLRIGNCEDVWIDSCHIHHTGEVCLSANTADTRRLHLTRNHIHHGGGHAEGMYLGGNGGSVIMSESVIAQNHIHDCGGEQGDGIELKQGSWGNLISGNLVHDCNYPCITVYGTGGKAVNVIENNVCFRSANYVMQVQGEAVVRNNLLINGTDGGFASTDHQGKTINLSVIHNTIINPGNAFRGGSWHAREGMVLANNLIYSRDADPIRFPAGRAGVTITGNVIFGDGPAFGSTVGAGIEDFAGIAWDGGARDAVPSESARLDFADPIHLTPTDMVGEPRGERRTSGALIRPRQ